MRTRIPLNKGVFLLPNLFTTGSLFFGFYSIIKSLDGNYYYAAAAIIIASLFDMIDGRLARLTKTESDFGVEYDSLADLISFGLAPGILSYAWVLHSFKKLGWLVAFAYVACAALRLARYNVQIFSIEKRHFQGLPTPSAAITVAGMVLLSVKWPQVIVGEPWWPVAVTGALALLMVSSVRYRSFKDLDLKSRSSFYTLVGAVALIVFIFIEPLVMFFVTFAVYVLSGVVDQLIHYQVLKEQQKQRREDRVLRQAQQNEAAKPKINLIRPQDGGS